MIKIKDWSSYQSYKDRRPPWIRFHRSILDNYDYQSMSADARALLPMLWLLACEDNDPTSGLIPYEINKIAFRLRQTESLLKKSIKELQVADFIECIESVTKPLQECIPLVTPETETETEKKNVLFEKAWDIYQKKGNRKTSIFRFMKLKQSDIDLLFIHLPKYVQATPDKQFRKDFQAYINQEVWNDEITQPTKKDNKNEGQPFREWGST